MRGERVVQPMCSRDDDPTQHDAPRACLVCDAYGENHDGSHVYVTPIPDHCPACGHPWGAHSTRAGAEAAIERGHDFVPCVAGRSPSLFGICDCRALAPETAARRQPTAGNI